MVTRLTSQIADAVTSAGARKLKQLKGSLTKKRVTLAGLDDELLETVDEELEAEIEQADRIQEDITLAVINIEEAL